MSFFSSPPLLDLGNNNDNNDNDDYGDSSTSPPSPPSPSPPPPEPSEGKKGDPIIVTSPPSPNQNSSNSNSSSNSPSPTSTPTPSDGKSSPIIGLSPSTTPTLTPNSSSENKHSPSVSSASNGSIDNSDNNSRVFTVATVSVGLLLLMMLGICFLCCRRRRRRKPRYYYGDDGKNSHNGSGDYYNPAQNPSDWHPSGNDHIVRVQQSQGMDSGEWGPVTPQQHSSDMSSNFSQRGPSSALPLSSPRLSFGVNCVAFSYEDLVAATDGFALRNLIGQGGFGYVHKGVLLNGKEVAIKCLKAGSGQGDREFQAEIEIISRVHHRHLVTLLGYCISGGQRILVYEFVPNNTLEYHLHSRKSPTLNWSYRMRIALGSAKGLAYLHEDCHPRIIHRDIKSANVLLDYSYEAKVADFGLAKLTTDTNTHVSTRVMGTFGYLAPEYASSGKLTEKSDVFSFGVMLLEIVTGRRPVDLQNMADDSLVDWARPLLTRGLEDGNFEELVDPFLEGNYSNRELSRIAACISASIRHSGKKRPKMSQIVRALEGDVSLEDLNESNVGHGLLMGSLSGSSEYGSSAYHADMKKFRQIALASQELGSSESSSGEMPQGHGQVSNYS